jgi:hypothetical protein
VPVGATNDTDDAVLGAAPLFQRVQLGASLPLLEPTRQ